MSVREENIGHIVKAVLNIRFSIDEIMLVDNYQADINPNIHHLRDLRNIEEDFIVIMTSDRNDIYDELLNRLYDFVPENKVVCLYHLDSKKTKQDMVSIQYKVLGKLDETGIYKNGMIYSPRKTKSEFFLPFVYMDMIQQVIFLSDDYYERNLLDKVFYDYRSGKVADFISNGNMTIIDVGANIGNHTLFFANEINASHIYSFEPIYETCWILKKNIEINHLENIVNVINCGLSDHDARAELDSYDYNNIGATSLDVSDNKGSMIIKRLDDYNIHHVGFIKIDVEGMELGVLKGAEKTILREKPYIMIESFPKRFDNVRNLLMNYGYRYEHLDDDCNYIFFPAE